NIYETSKLPFLSLLVLCSFLSLLFRSLSNWTTQKDRLPIALLKQRSSYVHRTRNNRNDCRRNRDRTSPRRRPGRYPCPCVQETSEDHTPEPLRPVLHRFTGHDHSGTEAVYDVH